MRKIDGVFIDENIIPVGVRLAALSEVGTVLYPGHRDIPELPTGSEDVDILKVLGERYGHLIFITRDKRIRYKKKERHSLIEAGIRTVVIASRKNLSPEAIYQLILQHWDKIATIHESESGPCIYGLTQSGVHKYKLTTQ